MKDRLKKYIILLRVYKETIKAVPLSCILGIMNYTAQGLLPTAITAILSKLFEVVEVVSDSIYQNDLLIYSGLLIAVYSLTHVLKLVSSITINAGIYERCTSIHKWRLAEKTTKLQLLMFEDPKMLNLKERAENCVDREILSQIFMSITLLLTNGISSVSMMLLLTSYHFLFFPIALLSVLPYFLSRIVRGKHFYDLKSIQSAKNRKVQYLWELFSNKSSIKEMRVFCTEKYLLEKWKCLHDDVQEEIWTHYRKDIMILFVCDAVRIVGYGLSIVFAFFLVLTRDISVGTFGGCIIAFKALQEATKALLIEVGQLSENLLFAGDYFAYLDLHEDDAGTISVDVTDNELVVDNVSFRYPNGENEVLKNISFNVAKGETVVIVGLNGSGKTTLAKILLGIYPAVQGKIVYGCNESGNINQGIYRQYASTVQQDFGKFNLTLRENIAIANIKELYNDCSIKAILQHVGLSSLIETGDIDIQLGSEFNGIELSGGQWQRLAIARGVFKRSNLIIVDEPTSSLDPLVEADILKQFIDVSKQRTTIIISHRIGLCKSANKIIVMKAGAVCEIGTHTDLMKAKGEYYSLYTAQQEWYK